jgi:tetratricopeptide (TPR) repeat protein
MKKKYLVLLFLMINSALQAQYVVNPQFKPFTFDELVAPMLLANSAYEKAIAQFEDYYDKYQKAFNDSNFSSAKYYIERMEDINNRFKFISSDKLTNAKKRCDELIVRQEKISEVQKKYELALNYIKREEFDNAKKLFKECSMINAQYELYDESIFDEAILYCEQAKLLNTIIDVSLPCTYKIGNAAPVTKQINYQTTGANDNCSITKITTNSKNTIIELEYKRNDSGWCSISPSTFIVDKRTGTKHTMLYCQGIALSPGKTIIPNTGGKVSFKLIFPSIPSTSYYIDLVEDESSPWKFYNLKVR